LRRAEERRHQALSHQGQCGVEADSLPRYGQALEMAKEADFRRFVSSRRFQDIDLKTVKIEDLDFTAPFELEATRQDCMSCLPLVRQS
jgi:hypothetical protein